MVYPFLLQVFEDKENGLLSKEDLIKILKLVQSYTWRRFIVGLPTSALNKIFMTLYSEVDSEEYYDSIAKALIRKKGSAKFPTDVDVKSALKDKDLYNTQPKNRDYLFEMLENYNNREHVNTSDEKITIEHIFPKSPNEDWGKALSQNEFILFKEKLLNTIANLTLSGNNGALGNKSFLAKKEMNVDGNEQGYQYSRLWLNAYLKSIDVWDVSKYEDRLAIIYNRFVEIWQYPDVEFIDDGDTEEQNIFDAESPTFKKLEYFIFENTRIEEDKVAQMYFYIIRCLYEKNSQLLLNNQEIFKITRNISDFRSAQEVANGWFFESNLGNDAKFFCLKKLLSLFELEDELIVKYSSNGDSISVPNRLDVRKKYWQQLLPLLSHTNLFDNVSPSKDQWLSTGAGIGGLAYTLIITKTNTRIELRISTSSKESNKGHFKKLFRNRDTIEQSFGCPLVWEELPDSKVSRVKYELEGINLFNESDWEQMNNFFLHYLPKFESAFQPFLKNRRQ